MNRIIKPTLIVDEEICKNNISRMSDKARAGNAWLRPHFKTHHSAEIGQWFSEYGVKACTASSVEMAAYFAKAGWKDITIAFPFNPLEAGEIAEIAKDVSLNILIESTESLSLANELIDHPVGYFVKIDIGTHRTGIAPNNLKLISKLVSGSSDKVQFKGFLAHAGHTYTASKPDIPAIFAKSSEILSDLKKQFGGIISYGDTPSCSLMDDLTPFDEIRAGNYVFFDWMQHNIGSCAVEDIGVCLACPIVAIHEDRGQVVVFGGAVHLSKDVILDSDGKKCFGKAVRLKEQGWQKEVIGNVVKLSQEHGVIDMAPEHLVTLKVGDLLGILPIHSCLAADLQGHYITADGQKIHKIIKE